MKQTLLLILLTLTFLLLNAAPVSQSEALSIAGSWMSRIDPSNSIAQFQPVPNLLSGETDWYLATFDQGGFILVSADDKIVPVLAYDTEALWTNSALQDNIAWYLNQYHSEITQLRSEADLSTHPDWQSVRNGDFTAFIPGRPVSPLLTTTWDQDWPYNSLCPTDSQGPGGHVYAGCGATTMAQIMKFWAYPTQGVGSHTYTHPVYGPLSANFGATTYNFASMPNSLSYSPNTAISTLMFHCGVALDMDYSPNGSGSYATAVRPAFINYFAYESTAQTVYKYAYTTAVWENMLRTDLDASRPIFYFGQDTTYGGHAWVCDGYQGTNYFHFNWGWSGYYNGYFYVSNLNPGMYNFSSQQGAVIGIRPTLPITAPSNLTAIVDAGNNVFLEWESPLNRSLTGYTIYRDGVICGTVADPLTTGYYDINLPAGTYSYYVIANYTQGDSDPSNTVSATVYPAPVINYQEGFETFDDFATDLTPWFGYDLDLAPTLTFDDYDFTGEGEAQSFMVFNPTATVPPLTDMTAVNGTNLLICLPSDGTANDDWFCSPKWNTGNIARLRFWARSAYADSGLAQIEVGISTSTPDPQNMTIISGDQPLEVPETWTGYDYTFPSYQYSNVFIGVHCLSNNGSALLLDRFQLWSSYVDNEDSNLPAPLGLNLSAYPNPFNSEVNLTWQQSKDGNSELRIYDLKGRLVKILSNSFRSPGTQTVAWDGTDNHGKPASSGVYFCKLTDSEGQKATHKLVLVK